MTILIALAALGGLTLILAAMLILANKKLYVYEDPRIDIVEDMLPHANCGACGYPGCRPFAEALVSGNALPGKCTVSTDEGRVKIADYLEAEFEGISQKAGFPWEVKKKEWPAWLVPAASMWPSIELNTRAFKAVRRRPWCPEEVKVVSGAVWATAIAKWPVILTPSP